MLYITLIYLPQISLGRHSKHTVNEKQTVILKILKGIDVVNEEVGIHRRGKY